MVEGFCRTTCLHGRCGVYECQCSICGCEGLGGLRAGDEEDFMRVYEWTINIATRLRQEDCRGSYIS